MHLPSQLKAIVNSIYILIIFFFKWLYPWHMEVPRPEVKPELQLQPTPQPQQYWFQATSATYITAVATPDPLTHCMGKGIKPAPLQQPSCCSQVLNPLHHSRNSSYSNKVVIISCSWLIYFGDLKQPRGFVSAHTCVRVLGGHNQRIKVWMKSVSGCLVSQLPSASLVWNPSGN